MRQISIGTILAGAIVVAVACKSDPTSGLREGPVRLALDPAVLVIDVGDVFSHVVATAQDAQLNLIATPFTATSNAPAIATVARDTTFVADPDGTHGYFDVTAVGLGETTITVSGGGLDSNVVVKVTPLVLPSTATDSTPTGGDTVTIASDNPVVLFEPDSVAVTFHGDAAATVLSATSTAITVLAPLSGAGTVQVRGVKLSYTGAALFALPTSFSASVTGTIWTGNDDFATAPTLALPGAGHSMELLSDLPSGNAANCPDGVDCAVFKFVLAAPAEVRFTVDWDSGADMDIYACGPDDPTACFEEGGGGATSAQPEKISDYTFPAGTHYFVVEKFAGTAPKNLYVTVSQP